MFEACFICGKERGEITKDGEKKCSECASRYFSEYKATGAIFLSYNYMAWWMTDWYVKGYGAGLFVDLPIIAIMFWVAYVILLHDYSMQGLIIMYHFVTLLNVSFNSGLIREKFGSGDVWVNVYYVFMALLAIYIVYALIAKKKRRAYIRNNYKESIEKAEALLDKKFLMFNYIKKYDKPDKTSPPPSPSSGIKWT